MSNLSRRLLSNYRRSQLMLYTIALPIFFVLALAGPLESIRRVALVVIGFSAIIFFHELGHFLVARWCSVRCDVFSIGIGPRMVGWRKGVGLSFGPDPRESKADKQKDNTAHGAVTAGDIEQTATTTAKKNEGDTDYRLSWLPLGGYVRMLGQDDTDPTKVSEDPHSFNMRPIWQRMCIVSAGVIMNVICAAIIFSIIFHPSVGVKFPPAIVGNVVYDSPAWHARTADNDRLMPGDRLITIDGTKPRGFLEFSDVVLASALSDGASSIRFEFIREGWDKSKFIDIKPKKSEGSGFLAVGIEQPVGNAIYGSQEELSEEAKKRPELANFKSGDKITSVNGQPVESYFAIHPIVQATAPNPVKLGLSNEKQGAREVEIKPTAVARLGGPGLPTVFGFGPRVTIDALFRGRYLVFFQSSGPGERGGLKVDDIVTRVGDVQNPSTERFREVIGSNAGNAVDVHVLRDGKTEKLTVTPALGERDGRTVGMINVQLGSDLDTAIAVIHDKTAKVVELGLPADARITKIGDTAVTSWTDVYAAARKLSPGQEVDVVFTAGEKTFTQKLALTSDEHKAVNEHVEFRLNLPVENMLQVQKAQNAFDAMMMGAEHTKKFILQTYMTLRGLFIGTVSPTNLHGIVGITKIGHDVQDRGFVYLLFVLGMVSVNLAVANFLPLPIVDGGLFLLLILEKIRGKPLSLKVQAAISYVGIVILAGLFLFVTYNDIGLFYK